MVVRDHRVFIIVAIAVAFACASSKGGEPEAYASEDDVPESIKMMEKMEEDGYRAPTWDTSSANTQWRDFYEEVNRVLDEKMRDVAWCWWEELRARKSRLGGKMTVAITIAPNGQVQDVTVPAWDILSATATQCVKDRTSSSIFPEPPHGRVIVYEWRIFFPD